MHAEAVVRLAAASDAAAIAAMSRDYIEQGLGWSWGPRRVLAAIRNPERNVAVIGSAPAVVAFGIMHYTDTHAHLELMAVHPSSRRRGLATALLGWLEKVALSAGAERIVVECRRSNDAARCLYLKGGYHERLIARGMYSAIEDGIRLEKWLRARAGGSS